MISERTNFDVKKRHLTLGASEVATYLGRNAYNKDRKLLMQNKLYGIIEPMTEYMSVGIKGEKEVIKYFADDYQMEKADSTYVGTKDSHLSMLSASPDAFMIYKGKRVGVEIKTILIKNEEKLKKLFYNFFFDYVKAKTWPGVCFPDPRFYAEDIYKFRTDLGDLRKITNVFAEKPKKKEENRFPSIILQVLLNIILVTENESHDSWHLFLYFRESTPPDIWHIRVKILDMDAVTLFFQLVSSHFCDQYKIMLAARIETFQFYPEKDIDWEVLDYDFEVEEEFGPMIKELDKFIDIKIICKYSNVKIN